MAVQRPDGTVAGVAWNMSQETKGETSLTFTLPAQGEWCLLTKTVDEDHANPLKVWHDLGEPRQLTAAQTALLQESAQPLVSTQRLTAEDGQLSFTLRLKEDAVVSFQLLPAAFQGDRGYDYRRPVLGDPPLQTPPRACRGSLFTRAKKPPAAIGRQGLFRVCRCCFYAATVTEVMWGLAPSYQ